jgi:hypothetical protein
MSSAILIALGNNGTFLRYPEDSDRAKAPCRFWNDNIEYKFYAVRLASSLLVRISCLFLSKIKIQGEERKIHQLPGWIE